MSKLRVLENFAGYGSQSIALDNLNIENEVVGISEIEPDAIIAYAALRGCDLNKTVDISIDDMKQILMNKNVGYDFQKNKSRIPRMKKDKLIQLFNADQFSNNLGDISIIKPQDVPQHDLFTYSFPCFLAGTLVLTSNGYKKIEDITDEDYVLTHTNNYQKVVKPMINYADHIYRMSTMSSEDIFVTEEHPFYVRKKHRKHVREDGIVKNKRFFDDPEWIKVKDLDNSYYVGSAINTKSELPKWQGIEYNGVWGHLTKKNELNKLFKNKDFWWLVGRFIGDGWTRDYKVRKDDGFKKHDERVIICCAKNELNEITEVLNRLPLKYNIVEERTVFKVHIVNKELTRYLYQFDKGASNKHLTSDVINLPVDLLESFLDGYISADGFINRYGFIKISSVSNRLIYDVSQCIMKVYKRPVSVYKTSRNKTCVIEGRTVNQRDTYTVTFKKDTRKQDNAFYENGYIWSPINKIEKIKFNGLVYNMEVENDNSYVVQNIIVHNCQDISVAGKQKGVIRGETRSGLLYECERIIEGCKPKYLLMENVKNLVGKKHKPQFDEWLQYLETLGYTNYWQVLNAKDYGVPQNRERVFVVSILGEHEPYKFPEPIKLDKVIRDILDDKVEEKYYINKPFKLVDKGRVKAEFTGVNFEQSKRIYGIDSYFQTLAAKDRGTNNILIDAYLTDFKYKQTSQILNQDGICTTLDTMQGGYREPKILCENIVQDVKVRKYQIDIEGLKQLLKKSKKQSNLSITDISNSLNVNRTTVEHWFRNDNCFSIPDEDIWYKLKELLQISTNEFDAGIMEFEYKLNEFDMSNRVYRTEGIAPTLTATGGESGAKMILREGDYRIRKLTPRECFRLMGLTDAQIDRIQQSELSDSVQYKLAGNSIVVQVLEGIFRNLFINNK